MEGAADSHAWLHNTSSYPVGWVGNTSQKSDQCLHVLAAFHILLGESERRMPFSLKTLASSNECDCVECE